MTRSRLFLSIIHGHTSSAMNILVPLPLAVLLLIVALLSPSPISAATTRAAPHSKRSSALSLFPTPSLHVFFYAWYGAPPHDVGYLHWTHSVLPHWREEVTNQHRKEPYVAPGDPGVTYYPERGLYSSHDSDVLEVQMAEMAEMGADVVVVSWWGQKHKNSSVSTQHRIRYDGQVVHRCHSPAHSCCFLNVSDGRAGCRLRSLHAGHTGCSREGGSESGYTRQSAAHIAHTAHSYTLPLQFAHTLPTSTPPALVCAQLEPYPLRSEYTVEDDLKYIFAQYGNHPAFYRHPTTNQCLVYAYDSYHMTPQQWQQLLAVDGAMSIRHTPHDCIVIALVLDNINEAVQSHFDGVYSYFAATGFTRAADPSQWKGYVTQAAQHGILFIPSVAPGYDDTRLRPWNGHNKHGREHGRYYDEMWQAAVDSGANIVAVTTYNEWGEGTQIEPARPFITNKGDRLRGYSEREVTSGQAGEVLSDGEERLYVERTKQWMDKWRAAAGAAAGDDSPHQDLR